MKTKKYREKNEKKLLIRQCSLSMQTNNGTAAESYIKIIIFYVDHSVNFRLLNPSICLHIFEWTLDMRFAPNKRKNMNSFLSSLPTIKWFHLKNSIFTMTKLLYKILNSLLCFHLILNLNELRNFSQEFIINFLSSLCFLLVDLVEWNFHGIFVYNFERTDNLRTI